ncbi:hypothetical protein FGE05_05950 [Pseudomonas sp. ICMP22404]|nr:hypothetical protein FGE05_05950 [Pseudomonas sp. ICMP22404]
MLKFATGLWRGDSSPLGCEAAPNQLTRSNRYTGVFGFRSAPQPSGAVRRFAESPRHKSKCSIERRFSAIPTAAGDTPQG